MNRTENAPRKPQLTATQARHVERAREVAASDAEVLAADYDRIDPGDLAMVNAYAFGVTRSTLAAVLEIIDELTGGAS